MNHFREEGMEGEGGREGESREVGVGEQWLQ